MVEGQEMVNFFCQKVKAKMECGKNWQQMLWFGFREEINKASFGSIVTFLVL